MQHPIFILLLFLGLLARWLLLPEARPARSGFVLLLGALLGSAPLIALQLPWPALLWPLGYGVAFSGLLLWRERGRHEAPGLRLLLLLGYVILIGLLAPRFEPASIIEFRLHGIPLRTLAWLVGALLCLKESNFFIRWFFAWIKTSTRSPGPNEEQKVRAETGNGRIIGSLERLLVYVLLLGGHTFSVPAVIAVKALARFKRMEEDQAFAEYVIIGTFLSILLTLGALGTVAVLAE